MSRKHTGIFFPYFQGQRLIDFPQALNGILDQEMISYYDGVYRFTDRAYYMKPVSEDLLLKVHTKDMIESVARTGYLEAALYSAGGSVQAANEIAEGYIDNAFVFTGHGDHHAGRGFFGGMCYLNGAALAIADLREKGLEKFAIVDTDCHHADGTRDIVAEDKDILHFCLCFQNYNDSYNNVDITIPYVTNDDYYLDTLKREFVPRIEAFRPQVIFWEYGYDATQGEYGDKGLTRDCHEEIAKIIVDVADRVCDGKLVAILCGGSGRTVATYTIPKIIRCLAGLDGSP